jgi:O-antigen/teichoic acid export membrane protein
MTTPGSGLRRGGMARNFVHLGLGQVTTTILSALLSAVVARVLSTSEFGLYFLLFSIATFAFVVVDWGHGTLVIREAARHPERAGELFGSTLTMRSIGAALACPIVFAVTWLLGYEMLTRVLAVVVIVASLPQYLGLSFGWVFRAYERMDSDALINVVFKLANLVFAILCLALGGRVVALLLAWGLAGCVTLAIAIAIYRKLQLPALTTTRAAAAELLRDGTPIFVMTLAIAIEPVVNANILYKMTSKDVVGWYGAAWIIAGTLIAPATVLSTAMYPRLSPAVDHPDEFRRLVNVSFRPLFLLAVLGAAGTWLFAEVPVAIIFSLPKYEPAADIVRAFAPLLLLMYVSLYLSMAALALRKASRLAAAKIVAVILVVVLTFFLVPYCQQRFGNGGLGVIYAMLVGELLIVCASWVLIREAIDRRTVADMLRGMLAGAATVLLFEFLPAMTPFLGVPLCVLVFGALSWATGVLKRSDLDMLLAAVRKKAPPPATPQ